MACCEDADPASVLGEWVIDRDVADLRAGLSGTFHGRLVVAAGVDGYTWSESGTLRWEGRTSPAARHLWLRLRGAQWWTTFSDGRPFHPWRPNTEVVHHCGQDVYTGLVSYSAGAPDRMDIRWDVAGPRKRQRLTSRYRRAEPLRPDSAPPPEHESRPASA